MFRRSSKGKTLSELAKAKGAPRPKEEAEEEFEERPSFSRVSFTRKSLSELADDLDAEATPRTPGERRSFERSSSDRSRRQPSGRFPPKRTASETARLRVEQVGDATHVTLETAPVAVPGGVSVATAAPACKGVAAPSASRAALLGARGGHFERTNVGKATVERVAIVASGEVTPTPTASDRERKLEARLAALEARLNAAPPAPPVGVS